MAKKAAQARGADAITGLQVRPPWRYGLENLVLAFTGRNFRSPNRPHSSVSDTLMVHALVSKCIDWFEFFAKKILF